MLATEEPSAPSNETGPRPTVLESWSGNERMRHIPTLEWILRKLEDDYDPADAGRFCYQQQPLLRRAGPDFRTTVLRPASVGLVGGDGLAQTESAGFDALGVDAGAGVQLERNTSSGY
mgnify:CR=1 FL=1